MSQQGPKENFDQLIRDGYCLVEDVLDADILQRLRQVTDQLLNAQSQEIRAQQRSTGSMIDVGVHPIFAELVAYLPARAALETLGFLRPRWMSGYVISKPPSSPALFWHQDWWGWDDPSSYTPLPQQLFLMYYLVDTTPHNGCLRLLRGSHLKRHRMHDEVPDAHTDELRRVADPDHPAYQSIPEEVDCTRGGGRCGHRRRTAVALGPRQQVSPAPHRHYPVVFPVLRPALRRPPRCHRPPPRMGRLGRRGQSAGCRSSAHL